MPARRALLSDELQAFQWGLHVDSDAIATVHGGLQTGTVTNNVIHFAVAMDTASLGGWRGGRLAASALRITSGEASVNHIGDLQVADNLDAASSARIYQLWYRQRFHPVPHGPDISVRGGLIDLNQNFAATDAASLLLNASFGLNPTLSANVPISTYPKPGFGLEGGLVWPQWQAHLGIFQANPNARNNGFSSGNLLIGELGYRLALRQVPIQLNVGLWRYHQNDPELAAFPSHDWGSYAFIDAALHGTDSAAHVFLQIGYAPASGNSVQRYLGLGVQVPSPLPGRANDVFTAGLAHARIHASPAGSETSYEISYLINLHRYVTLQPDLQYIHHPSGRLDLHDAVVALLRLHLEFY